MTTLTKTKSVTRSAKNQASLQRPPRKEAKVGKDARVREAVNLIHRLEGSLKDSKAWDIFLAERKREHELDQ